MPEYEIIAERTLTSPDDPNNEVTVLEGLAPSSLPPKQKRFRKRPAAADLERSEVLIPIALWDFRFRCDPETKLIEVGDTDRPVVHSIGQMLTNAGRKMIPALDLRHQPPKTMRPI